MAKFSQIPIRNIWFFNSISVHLNLSHPVSYLNYTYIIISCFISLCLSFSLLYTENKSSIIIYFFIFIPYFKFSLIIIRQSLFSSFLLYKTLSLRAILLVIFNGTFHFLKSNFQTIFTFVHVVILLPNYYLPAFFGR